MATPSIGSNGRLFVTLPDGTEHEVTSIRDLQPLSTVRLQPVGPMQLRRQPRRIVAGHRLRHTPDDDRRSIVRLGDAAVEYARGLSLLGPAERGFLTMFALQARAELYRRIASHQQIID